MTGVPSQLSNQSQNVPRKWDVGNIASPPITHETVLAILIPLPLLIRIYWQYLFLSHYSRECIGNIEFPPLLRRMYWQYCFPSYYSRECIGNINSSPIIHENVLATLIPLHYSRECIGNADSPPITHQSLSSLNSPHRAHSVKDSTAYCVVIVSLYQWFDYCK